MIDLDLKSNYSAEITLSLEVNGHAWPLAMIGPDSFVPKQPIQLDPCDAEIVMTIDGKERRWPVRLIDGATPFDKDVRISDRQAA